MPTKHQTQCPISVRDYIAPNEQTITTGNKDKSHKNNAPWKQPGEARLPLQDVQSQPNLPFRWAWGSDCKGRRRLSGMAIMLFSGSKHRGVFAFVKFIKPYKTM